MLISFIRKDREMGKEGESIIFLKWYVNIFISYLNCFIYRKILEIMSMRFKKLLLRYFFKLE